MSNAVLTDKEMKTADNLAIHIFDTLKDGDCKAKVRGKDVAGLPAAKELLKGVYGIFQGWDSKKKPSEQEGLRLTWHQCQMGVSAWMFHYKRFGTMLPTEVMWNICAIFPDTKKVAAKREPMTETEKAFSALSPEDQKMFMELMNKSKGGK